MKKRQRVTEKRNPPTDIRPTAAKEKAKKIPVVKRVDHAKIEAEKKRCKEILAAVSLPMMAEENSASEETVHEMPFLCDEDSRSTSFRGLLLSSTDLVNGDENFDITTINTHAQTEKDLHHQIMVLTDEVSYLKHQLEEERRKNEVKRFCMCTNSLGENGNLVNFMHNY